MYHSHVAKFQYIEYIYQYIYWNLAIFQLTPVKLHEMVLKGVNRMNWSRDINEYTLNQNQSLNEWKQYPDLDNFRV